LKASDKEGNPWHALERLPPYGRANSEYQQAALLQIVKLTPWLAMWFGPNLTPIRFQLRWFRLINRQPICGMQVCGRASRFLPRYWGLTASMGEAMEPIPRELLDAIRQLNNESLTRLIEEINAVGWPRAADTLRLMMQERKAR